MDEYNLEMLITAFSLFLIFLGFLIWGIRTGQFTDIEEAKYRILEIPDEMSNRSETNNHQGEKI
jgi:cbb3-type cytochrome oxidase maturation protein